MEYKMYGQKNYLASQGVPAPAGLKNYRIDQIGCFLVSFCNLLKKYFNIDVDPVTLNNFFIQRGVYIDAAPKDRILDDLFWAAVTAFAPNVTVQVVGRGGWPASNVSIVCFHYRSVHTGEWIDHFCLVADAANRVIIDSWDGITKGPAAYEGIYGQPTQFASYTAPAGISTTVTTSDNHPAVVRPYTVEKITPKVVRANKQPTNKYGMNYDNFTAIAKDVQATKNAGDTMTVSAILHHQSVPYSYYLENADDQAGWNVLDFDDVPAPEPALQTAPEPVKEPEAPVVPGLQTTNPPMTEVTPTAPQWQLTSPKVADWEAVQDYQVVDLETGVAAAMLYKGQTVHSVVKLTKDGQEYVLTQKSVDKKAFNGVPTKYLQLKQDFTPKKDVDDDGILDLDDLKLDEFMADSARIAKDAVEKVKSNKTIRDFFVNLFAKFYRKK